MHNKWKNIFWHQPQKSDGDLRSIENNVTKDLIFLLTSEKTKKISKQFTKKLSKKLGKKNKLGDMQRTELQVNLNKLKESFPPEKNAHLIFLCNNAKKSNKRPDNNARAIIDAAIEYKHDILFLEVKTFANEGEGQLEKYKQKLEKHFKMNFQGIKEINWDEIYEIVGDREKNRDIITYFLSTQYQEMLRVMGLTEKFYGFWGYGSEEHDHEILCLLKHIKNENYISGLKFGSSKRGKSVWRSLWLDEGEKDNKNLHFTIYRSNEDYELVLTLRDSELKKLFPVKKKTERSLENINKRIIEICKWNENDKGQKTYGRTVMGILNKYGSLSGNQSSKAETIASINIRLDSVQAKKREKKRLFDEEILMNMNEMLRETIKVKPIQAQIGFHWKLKYDKTRSKWKQKDFVIKQTTDVLKQLVPLYKEIRQM